MGSQNKAQGELFDEIKAAVDADAGGAYFVDAPAGTGKTYLSIALLNYVRSTNQIALAVASSGIAATLMPGGRAAHSPSRSRSSSTSGRRCRRASTITQKI